VLRIKSAEVRPIRTSHADLYWATTLNATATIAIGDGPNVRRSRIVVDDPDFSHFMQLDGLSSNKVYFFEITSCAGGACVSSPTLNFTTPRVDDYSLPAAFKVFTGELA
jgi:hypothetical protein